MASTSAAAAAAAAPSLAPVAKQSSNGKGKGKVRGRGRGNMILVMSMALAAVLLLFGASNSPVVECQQQEQLTVESRHLKGGNKELTDTINELEQMDKFFSELARPRFGRSEFKQAASRGFGMDQPPLPYRGSLIELINNRLAQKYRDSLAY